jgi:purine-binding chemotaxis protein CheW
MSDQTRQFSTFYLDRLLVGVEVLRVQEVIRCQPMTAVPTAPPAVRGLINLRGRIVTALDLRARLGLGARAGGAEPMNVVLRGDDGVSLLVDRVGEVVEVDDQDFEPAPEMLSGAARELIRGAYKLRGQLLLVLDVERATAVEE